MPLGPLSAKLMQCLSHRLFTCACWGATDTQNKRMEAGGWWEGEGQGGGVGG